MHELVSEALLEMLILRALSPGRALNGFAIARWVEGATEGELQIAEGAVYPALHGMRCTGRVQAERCKADNGRIVTHYRITVAGRQQLNDAIESWKRLTDATQQALVSEQ